MEKVKFMFQTTNEQYNTISRGGLCDGGDGAIEQFDCAARSNSYDLVVSSWNELVSFQHILEIIRVYH